MIDVLPVGELLDRLESSGFDLDGTGAPRTPALVVDLDAAPTGTFDLERARRALASSRTVVVGMSDQVLDARWRPLLAEFACTLVPASTRSTAAATEVPVRDVDAAARETGASCSRSPRAATVLHDVLRLAGHTMLVRDALVVESLAYSTLLAGPEHVRWKQGRAARRLPEVTTPAVDLVRDGAELRVTLNRPERRNAFGRDMREGLVEAFDLVLADQTIERVVLAGRGASFSSGGDLDEFGAAPDPATAHLVRLDRSVALRLDRCRDRVVARVHGDCIGAGVEIPSFAGDVIADPAATFRLPEVGMGLIPGAGGTVGIPRRIGRWRAAYLALTGASLDAQTALDWGLVDALDG